MQTVHETQYGDLSIDNAGGGGQYATFPKSYNIARTRFNFQNRVFIMQHGLINSVHERIDCKVGRALWYRL